MNNTDGTKLWVPGDWNAFFGFGTNILVNLLTLTALFRFVLKMPDELVFGRILPATGLMMGLSTLYYARLAFSLAKKTGRTDVCALPSGISVPHMFVVTFVIMLPIAVKTGDPVKGWEAGLTWVFIQSFVLMGGGFIAPIVRRITPRAALLGTLVGVSLTFISMGPGLQMFMTPVIGLVCFAIILLSFLLSWFGGVRYFRGVPAGLVAIAVGTIVAWGSTALGLNYGGMTLPVPWLISGFTGRFRCLATCFRVFIISARFWLPRSPLEFMTLSKRSTTWKVRRRRETVFRQRACWRPTASSI
jgi:adenine/guanine/hypoxanthine permease